MARPEHSVNIEEKLAKVTEYWSPKTILEVNGLEVKAVKVKGEFVWHSHPEGDELFVVISGELTIEIRDRESVRLGAGEMFVVPRDVEHKPFAAEECQVLIMDAAGVVNTGEAESDLTASEEWI
ncbi:cupin domain-containing protein [Streptomyces cyaneofuscatus]|uniref:cupin domain-containing protein n=1 Tax=Streptomyces cyaneofuscatus TaxID=66883 RepID=UPI00381A00A0